MTQENTLQSTIVRTKRGLSIAGTRITLYDVMDYLVADWPPRLIRDWLNLTGAQIAGAMEYIENNRAQVEAEYRQVLQRAEDIRQYWEDRNRERFAEIASKPPPPGQEAIRAKLQAWKLRLQFGDQFTIGYGNHTKERQTLFGEMSLDEITAEIKRTRRTIAPADNS